MSYLKPELKSICVFSNKVTSTTVRTGSGKREPKGGTAPGLPGETSIDQRDPETGKEVSRSTWKVKYLHPVMRKTSGSAAN
jgi:hypothetical protein